MISAPAAASSETPVREEEEEEQEEEDTDQRDRREDRGEVDGDQEVSSLSTQRVMLHFHHPGAEA